MQGARLKLFAPYFSGKCVAETDCSESDAAWARLKPSFAEETAK